MNVAGRTPREVVEPQTVDDLAGCLRALYAGDTAFAVCGGGTQLELGNPPRALDTLVKTTACSRVIEYSPEDQTITVEAGMTIAAVNDVLARERQFLAVDAPDSERATIGGAIATNLYGGRRLRYGSIKDSIVGVEIVRPDGTRARGGGKVVKNVAGFDMPKLMVGSLGTLGAIASATFRVYPIEEQRSVLTCADASIEQIIALCRELVRDALVPAAVVAFDGPQAGRFGCRVVFEGFAQGVEAQIETARSAAARLGLTISSADDAGTAVDERERAVRCGPAWQLAISAPPTALAVFLSSTPMPAGVRSVVYPMLGTAFFGAETLDVATVLRWRALLDGGSVVVHAMPPEARGMLDAWGEPLPAALAIMRRLKTLFDPKGLCNAGRFVGGL